MRLPSSISILKYPSAMDGMLLCSSFFLFLTLRGLQIAGEFLSLAQEFYGNL